MSKTSGYNAIRYEGEDIMNINQAGLAAGYSSHFFITMKVDNPKVFETLWKMAGEKYINLANAFFKYLDKNKADLYLLSEMYLILQEKRHKFKFDDWDMITVMQLQKKDPVFQKLVSKSFGTQGYLKYELNEDLPKYINKLSLICDEAGFLVEYGIRSAYTKEYLRPEVEDHMSHKVNFQEMARKIDRNYNFWPTLRRHKTPTYNFLLFLGNNNPNNLPEAYQEYTSGVKDMYSNIKELHDLLMTKVRGEAWIEEQSTQKGFKKILTESLSDYSTIELCPKIEFITSMTTVLTLLVYKVEQLNLLTDEAKEKYAKYIFRNKRKRERIYQTTKRKVYV